MTNSKNSTLPELPSPRPFNQLGGGHAPGELHKSFRDFVEVYARGDNSPPVFEELMRLSVELWDCADRMPEPLVDYIHSLLLSEFRIYSYAQGAGVIRDFLFKDIENRGRDRIERELRPKIETELRAKIENELRLGLKPSVRGKAGSDNQVAYIPLGRS